MVNAETWEYITVKTLVYLNLNVSRFVLQLVVFGKSIETMY